MARSSPLRIRIYFFPRMALRLLTISLIESLCETFAMRSANLGLYLTKSPRVILCQIGKITFWPDRSLAKSPFSSCSVQCFPLRNALEKTTIPYRELASPRSIELLRSSPHPSMFLSYQTRIPARSRAFTSGVTNFLSSVAWDTKTSGLERAPRPVPFSRVDHWAGCDPPGLRERAL